MTDREIIDGLIRRDNVITRQLFFVTARPLLTALMHRIFAHAPDYDEIVSELYAFLIDRDCAKLRTFSFECSFMTWLKVVATRYFLRYRKNIVEESSSEDDIPAVFADAAATSNRSIDARIDIEILLAAMVNQRYVTVIRRLVLDEAPPDDVALEMGVTVDNLYNVKRRALAALTAIALNMER